MLTRREFLRRGLILVTASAAAPAFLVKAAAHAQVPSADPRSRSRNVLVVVQLSGGNDGLNTVIPYRDPLYRELRPRLAVPEAEALPLDAELALHPALGPLKERFDAGQLAIVAGVGYPNPDRSHFRAMDIWQTAEPEAYAETGWLGRYLAGCACGGGEQAAALSLTPTLPRALWTESVFVPSLTSLAAYRFQSDPRYPADRAARLRALQALDATTEALRPYAQFLGQQSLNALASAEAVQRVAGSWQTPIEYPENNPLAVALKAVGQLIGGDYGLRVAYVQLGGFDTHANQQATHQRLLEQLGGALDAFQRDLEAMGKADQVVTMTFSEFGRRVRENGSGGTDHGTAEPLFILGTRVRGGLYGRQPPLDDLDSGDLRFQVDFRAVYATLLDRWLGSDPVAVLGRSYAPLDFVGA
ncbi:MAG TPA: DUF1501 domain-containing protein [Chloroflexota bacterium]|jgi:uncharacterized protein (DUF1501 family)|nr:DUF1501 domain-containing protein [Chloroflexota bacterium]